MNKFTLPGGYANKPISGAETKGKDGVRRGVKRGSLLPPPRLPGFRTVRVTQ